MEEDTPVSYPNLCLVCRLFEIYPVGLARDPDGAPRDEAHRLCRPHRTRFWEGGCVLCAGKERWMAYNQESDIAWCRSCYVDRLGEEFARSVEEDWASQDAQEDDIEK